jgi:hypothetical protein
VINGPDEPEARLGSKGSTRWIGYTVYVCVGKFLRYSKRVSLWQLGGCESKEGVNFATHA